MHDREARILRERNEDASGELDRLDDLGPPGAGPMLAVTKTLSSYPSAASKYFAVDAVDPGGTEGEGNAGTFTTVDGTHYALNVGTTVPPSGTKVLIFPVGGRWVFRYNG